MRKIYKYKIKSLGMTNILMPQGAQILSAQWQYSSPVSVWAIVDPNAPQVARSFYTVMTDAPPPDDPRYKFLATIQEETEFVYHVFVLEE